MLETHFPGVRTVRMTDGTERAAVSELGSCNMVRVFLDDLRVPDDDLASITLSELAGIEYYTAASQPVQYKLGRHASCPLLILWSRR